MRVIAATHRDLVQMVNNNEFREDLWYRLNVFPLIVPPLRNRIDDIPHLTNYFIGKISKDLRLSRVPKINTHDMTTLQSYNFPGNVRELQNIIERALIHYDDLADEWLSVAIDNTREVQPQPGLQSSSSAQTLNEVIRHHIQQTLKKTHGRIQGPAGAANLLGLPASTLRAKMKKLDIRR